MTKPTITITDSAGNSISGLRLMPDVVSTIRIYCSAIAANIYLNATRGDFLEEQAAGEDESTARTNGQELLEDGLIQARLSGGTWQDIGFFENALDLGAFAAGAYKSVDIRVVSDSSISTIGLTAIGFAIRIPAE